MLGQWGQMSDLRSLHALEESSCTNSEERRVGVPKREAILTSRLLDHAGALFPPGSGRSSWLILEPQTGFGVPDALLLRASPTAVLAHQHRGLRIPTLSAAQVLTAGSNEVPTFTRRHTQSLRLDLARSGWTAATVRRAADVVTDSLAVEVKLQDAKRALQQLSKFRVSTHRAAVCMPEATAHRVSRTTLERFGAGLLVADDRAIHWNVEAVRRELPTFRRVWLAELLLRALEAGTAYRLSAPRKRSIADSSARTLPR